ncbi:MAG: hypothetical protein PVH73_01585 [Candidatus Bathyarchaeota archaeon]|jgi:hypothetical protein
MVEYWDNPEFRKIYNRVQRQQHRLKSRQAEDIILTSSELEFLAKSPVAIARSKYDELLTQRENEKKNEALHVEYYRKRCSLKFGRFANPDKVVVCDAIKVGRDYIPIPRPKKDKQAPSGWEGYNM